MKEAALFDGFAFDPLPFQHDDVAAPEVDIGGRKIADAVVLSTVIVMLDERRDLGFEITRQEVVFEQDAILERSACAAPWRCRSRKPAAPVPACR